MSFARGDNDGDDRRSHGVYTPKENKTSVQFHITQAFTFEKNYVLRDLSDISRISSQNIPD